MLVYAGRDNPLRCHAAARDRFAVASNVEEYIPFANSYATQLLCCKIVNVCQPGRRKIVVEDILGADEVCACCGIDGGAPFRCGATADLYAKLSDGAQLPPIRHGYAKGAD